jgi:hypothetical protein
MQIRWIIILTINTAVQNVESRNISQPQLNALMGRPIIKTNFHETI